MCFITTPLVNSLPFKGGAIHGVDEGSAPLPSPPLFTNLGNICITFLWLLCGSDELEVLFTEEYGKWSVKWAADETLFSGGGGEAGRGSRVWGTSHAHNRGQIYKLSEYQGMHFFSLKEEFITPALITHSLGRHKYQQGCVVTWRDESKQSLEGLYLTVKYCAVWSLYTVINPFARIT